MWRALKAATAIGFLTAGLAVVSFPSIRTAGAAVLPGTSPSEVFGRQRVRILLLGADRDYGVRGERLEKAGRSDTIVLADLDTASGKAHLCSIPRDTQAEIPGHGRRKVNAAFAVGGSDLARRTVEGLIDAAVPYVVAVDIDGFREAVDAVGGIDVVVEKPLRYDDNWGNLHINIPEGPQHLDGDTAMQFVRYRSDALADIGRTRRQQDFLKAFKQALSRPGAIVAWPGVVRSVSSHTDTNLTAAQMIALGRFAASLDAGDITTETLPGEFRGSRWRPDREALRRLASNTTTAAVD